MIHFHLSDWKSYSWRNTASFKLGEKEEEEEHKEEEEGGGREEEEEEEEDL